MSEFGVSEKTARQCFNMFTINNTRELDFDYFVSLFEEYYLSDDPSDLGNFINGRLEYPDDDSSDAETHGKVQGLKIAFFQKMSSFVLDPQSFILFMTSYQTTKSRILFSSIFPRFFLSISCCLKRKQTFT